MAPSKQTTRFAGKIIEGEFKDNQDGEGGNGARGKE